MKNQTIKIAESDLRNIIRKMVNEEVNGLGGGFGFMTEGTDDAVMEVLINPLKKIVYDQISRNGKIYGYNVPWTEEQSKRLLKVKRMVSEALTEAENLYLFIRGELSEPEQPKWKKNIRSFVDKALSESAEDNKTELNK